MKILLTIICACFSLVISAQSLQEFNTTELNENFFGEIYGVISLQEAPGKTISVHDTHLGQTPYLSFLRTNNYSISTSKHFSAGTSQLYPYSILKAGDFIYVGIELLEPGTISYALLKMNATNGTPILFKRISGPSITQNGSIKLYSIENSNDFLVALFGNSTSGSELNIFSVNNDFQTTSIKHKISFSQAEAAGFSASSSYNTDYVLSGTEFYYSQLFKKDDDYRLEIGQININTGSANPSYGLYSSPYHEKPTKVLKIKNDTIYCLVDNSLAIFPPNATSIIFYKFDGAIDAHNNSKKCINLVETEHDGWVSIFDPFPAIHSHSPICTFKPIDGSEVKHYTSSPAQKNIHINGNEILMSGIHNSRSGLSVDEFRIQDIASCHNLVNTESITTNVVNIHTSTIHISIPPITLDDLSLPAEANLNTSQQTICNPNHLGFSENKEKTFSVYPNPTSDLFHIQTDNETIAEISIKTFTGTEIYKSSENPSIPTIDISLLPAGIYLVQVKTKNTSYTQKIIKQ